MANEEISNMPLNAPAAEDLLQIINDPLGTPTNQQTPLSAVLPWISITQAEIDAGLTDADINILYEPGNVLRYGANTTPGTTDMTTAIQAALDSVGDGQSVFFPPSIYLLSSNVTLSSKNNISVCGHGALLKEASGVLTAMLSFTSCDFLRIDGLDFEAGEDDTYFQANSPTGSGREFISLLTCDDVFISRISGKNKRNFITTAQCNRVNISNFTFYGFAGTKASPNTTSNQNFLWCINLIDTDYVSVTNGQCFEHGSTVLSQSVSTNITIANLSSRDVHDNGVYISSGTHISISGCAIRNSNGDGIQVRGENISIVGNSIEGCGDIGIAATPTSATDGSCVISSNHIDGCGRGSRAIANTNQPVDVVISNNVIQNCIDTGDVGVIEIGSTIGRVSICGNIIRTSATDDGIFISDTGAACTHIVICNNLISDLNGSAASTRGAIRVDDGAELVISNNVFHDIASGIGVRLNSCDGGVVSGNIYEGGQVARIPAAETNTNLLVIGNRGSTIVVDGANNKVFQNDAVVTGYGITTLANDATPSVLGAELFKTGGTTAITDFDDGEVGQTIKILAAHSVTITDGAPIILSGGANFTMVATDTLTLTMFDDQVWQEVSRSVN